MRSRYRCSMCPAIHINSRSWLRSSSTHEPSDPPLRVVCVNSAYSTFTDLATVRVRVLKKKLRMRRGDRRQRFVRPSPTSGRSPKPAHRTQERPTCDRYPEASTGIQSRTTKRRRAARDNVVCECTLKRSARKTSPLEPRLRYRSPARHDCRRVQRDYNRQFLLHPSIPCVLREARR